MPQSFATIFYARLAVQLRLWRGRRSGSKQASIPASAAGAVVARPVTGQATTVPAALAEMLACFGPDRLPRHNRSWTAKWA
jgi:hypothetical protein